MSKHIEQIPLTRIARLQFWPNNGRRTLAQVMELTGADIGVNGTLYNPDWSPCGHVKADGAVLGAAPWTCWGYAWDSGCGLRMERLPCGKKNYITGTELLSPSVGAGDKLVYPAALGGSRGRTALGIAGSALVLYCCADAADGATLEEVRAELLALGCETALALDGGQSAKYWGGGVVIDSPARPVVQNYILIWLTPETGGGLERSML